MSPFFFVFWEMDLCVHLLEGHGGYDETKNDKLHSVCSSGGRRLIKKRSAFVKLAASKKNSNALISESIHWQDRNRVVFQNPTPPPLILLPM